MQAPVAVRCFTNCYTLPLPFLPFAIHHYDTPGNFDKNLRFVTMKMSTLKVKDQVGATIYSSHDNTNDKNYSNQNAEKVVGKRITTNRSTNIQMFNQSPLIRLKETSTV